MTIGFLYERYRLITEDDFQDPGRRRVGEIDKACSVILLQHQALTYPTPSDKHLNNNTELNFYGIT